jgi:hypothetical protein
MIKIVAMEWLNSFLMGRDYTCDFVPKEGIFVGCRLGVCALRNNLLVLSGKPFLIIEVDFESGSLLWGKESGEPFQKLAA